MYIDGFVILLSVFTGILIGTLTMELGGKVSIECEKTGYRVELEFKLKVSKTIQIILLLNLSIVLNAMSMII